MQGSFLAGVPGFEPGPTVLETATLPLNYTPVYNIHVVRTAHNYSYIQNCSRKHTIYRPGLWSSPRPISSSPLCTLPHLHSCPIYLVVFEGPYFFKRMGGLVLGGASRLDAFSVYPVRTWLPSGALGSAAGTPAVRPSRSSRTEDSSPQASCARAG